MTRRTKKQQRRFYARQPQPIGKVLGQVMINNRYASAATTNQFQQVWREVVGEPLASRSQATGVKHRKLQVTVTHSAIAQELSFEQTRLVQALAQRMPESNIDGLKFTVGAIEKPHKK